VASFIATDEQLQLNRGCCFLVQAILPDGYPFHQFSLLINFTDCGRLDGQSKPHVLNVTTNGTLYGDMATAFCEDGYRLTGTFNNSITTQDVICQSDGMWDEVRGCELKGIMYFNFIAVYST